MYCGNCGTLLSDQAMACHVCGTPTYAQQTASAPDQYAQASYGQYASASAQGRFQQPQPQGFQGQNAAQYGNVPQQAYAHYQGAQQAYQNPQQTAQAQWNGQQQTYQQYQPYQGYQQQASAYHQAQQGAAASPYATSAAQPYGGQAYASPAQTTTYSGLPTPMLPPIKSDRSLVVLILLSIITCGIYSFYFIYKLAQDVNRMCQSDGSNTGGLVAYILLSTITFGLYSLYWEYKLANRLQQNAHFYGLYLSESGTTVLLWCLIGTLFCGIGYFVAQHIIIKNTNALAMAYNGRIGMAY